jgi:hypothetical protein
MSNTAARFEEDVGPPPRTETLALTEITRDPAIKSREIDFALVVDYQDDMAGGDQFPPVAVMRDGDAVNWLIDGWHRVEAASRNKIESLRCRVCKGDHRAAVLASAAVNADHGHRRTRDDKRRAVSKLLEDPEWSKWSDREIARRCRVSNTFVSQERAALVAANLTVNVDSEQPRVVQFVTKHGDVASMNVKPRTSKLEVHRGRETVILLTSFNLADLKSLVGKAERSEKANHIDRATAGEIKRLAQKLLKVAERALHRSAKHTRKVSRPTS